MSLRMSFFIFLSSVSVARSLADEQTRYVTFPILCSVVVTGAMCCIKEKPPFFRNRIIQFMNRGKSTIQRKMGFSSDGCWQQLHGSFTPSHACGCAAQCFEGVQRGSIIVLPVRSSPASCHACFAARCCSLCFSPTGKSGHGAPAVRLGTGRMCPILPYAAPPLICAAFFVKEQTGQIYAKRKGVKRFAFTYLP